MGGLTAVCRVVQTRIDTGTFKDCRCTSTLPKIGFVLNSMKYRRWLYKYFSNWTSCSIGGRLWGLSLEPLPNRGVTLTLSIVIGLLI